MGRFWNLLVFLHSAAGPCVMLLYPLYASVVAIESETKLDDEQWLAYWILYSFLTLMEMLLLPLLDWIPIWYDVKLVFIAWLALPPFNGAAFIYDKLVRQKLLKRYNQGADDVKRNNQGADGSPKDKAKKKSVHFTTTKAN